MVPVITTQKIQLFMSWNLGYTRTSCDWLLFKILHSKKASTKRNILQIIRLLQHQSSSTIITMSEEVKLIQLFRPLIYYNHKKDSTVNKYHTTLHAPTILISQEKGPHTYGIPHLCWPEPLYWEGDLSAGQTRSCSLYLLAWLSLWSQSCTGLDSLKIHGIINRCPMA